MKKNWPYSKFPFQSKVKLIFPVNIVRPSDQLAKLEAARASIFHLNLVAGKIKKSVEGSISFATSAQRF